MEWVHRWRAMGVDCKVVASEPLDAAWCEAEVARAERALSRFDPQSELTALCRRGSGTVSAELQQVLLASITIAHWTAGMVVPHLGATMAAIGYDRTYASIVPNADPIDLPVLPDWRDIRVRGRQVQLPAGTHLDLNGVAKGWLAQHIAERSGLARILVEVGGEVAVVAPAQDPWCVAIDHPTAAEPLALLSIGEGTVATSSVCERRWRRAGGTVHHIIDPRTGVPAVTDVRTASVIAADGVYAEAAAKVGILLGAEAGIRWLTERGLAGLLYTADERILTTPAFATFLWEYDT